MTGAAIRCIVPSADGGTCLFITSDACSIFASVTGSHDAKQASERVVTPVQTNLYLTGRPGVAVCPEVICQLSASGLLTYAQNVPWRFDAQSGTSNASPQDPLQALAIAKDGPKSVRRLHAACLSLDLPVIGVLVNAGVKWRAESVDSAAACWWAPTELLFREAPPRLSLPRSHASWMTTRNGPVPPALRPLLTAALNLFLEYALDELKSAPTTHPSTDPSAASSLIGHWRSCSVRVRVLRDAMLAGEPVRVLRQMSTPDVRSTTLGSVIAKQCAPSELSCWKWNAASALRTALWAYHTGRLEASKALVVLIVDAIDVADSVPHSELQWLWLPVSTTPRSASNDSKSAPSPAIDWALVRSLLRACIASKRLVKSPECLQFLAADPKCMDVVVGESPHASRLLRSSTGPLAPRPSVAVSTAVTTACERRRQVVEECISQLLLLNVAPLIVEYSAV